MAIINPDLSEAAGQGAIDPGTYKARITAAVAQDSSKGNPMVVPTFAVTVDGKERTRKAWLNTNGPAAFKFDSLLRAVGMDDLANRYKNKEQVPFDTDSLIGHELNVVIDSELYNNETRDSIKSFLRA